MYGVVKIGEKDVPMLALASTDVYYKNVFREDPIRKLTEGDASDNIDLTVKAGFIMAMRASNKTRAEMMKLNEDAFYDWLDQFERADLYNNDTLQEIFDIYDGNKERMSKSKNPGDQ